MSGHSKWANIKHKKARADEAKGKIFTKVAKEIYVAVKQGGPDPDGNFRLKLAIQKAKECNMPNDNINRAIQKAAGANDNNAYEEFYYEGYGPAGVAVLCEILTDNRNRTASEIRHIFSRHGGNLGETGCVAWMFDRKGRMTVDMEGREEDDVMMAALDAGAEDVNFSEEEAEIIVAPDDLEPVRDSLTAADIVCHNAEIAMIPQNTIDIEEVEVARKLLRLTDALEDNDDVQNIYANFSFTDDVEAMLEEE